MQARFTLKPKFEGIREDEVETLESELTPLTTDTFR